MHVINSTIITSFVVKRLIVTKDSYFMVGYFKEFMVLLLVFFVIVKDSSVTSTTSFIIVLC